jgi:hypothetical protein
MLATATNILGAIAWSPEIRNILSVSVGIAVLIGSVYLIVGTNVGLRTGLLVTLAGLFGWMATMGVIWWIYGIGMLGEGASWQVREINYSDRTFAALEDSTIDDARLLRNLAELPTPAELLEGDPSLVESILPVAELSEEDIEARAANINLGQIIEADPEIAEEGDFDGVLGGWHLLPQSDRQRGDAVATADAFLGPDGRGLFESSSGYLVLDAFSIGGKDPLPTDPNRWDRIWHEIHNSVIQPLHPTHYAVVQVQAVVPQETEPGQAPPIPQIDEDAPVISVIMVRDLGDKRFPAFMVTIVFGLLFALTCWMLHRRDAVVAERRAKTPA